MVVAQPDIAIGALHATSERRSTTRRVLHAVVDSRRVRCAFQPLIDLDSGAVAGYEALARGPRGSELESPLDLFAAAEEVGRMPELDWICRASALEAAAAAGLDRGLSWFVNVEPGALRYPCPSDLAGVIAKACEGLRVVVEFAERRIGEDPAGLLAAAQRVRKAGFGVAVDDVGAEPDSLALLPFIQPDVVKLDMSLLHGRSRAHVAAVANGVRAYAEATGAVILAEGIETPTHERAARVLGATYGQGWLYGRPGPLPERAAAVVKPFPLYQAPTDEEDGTPFSLTREHFHVARTSKELLLPMSRHLEDQATVGGQSVALIGCFQEARFYTPRTRRRYSELSERSVFTAALAAGLRHDSSSRVLSIDLSGDDPLVEEWNVVVVGPHFAGALLARDTGNSAPDMQREFDYVITHDRTVVLRAARRLLRWMVPERGDDLGYPLSDPWPLAQGRQDLVVAQSHREQITALDHSGNDRTQREAVG